jgi:hypothetical protein
MVGSRHADRQGGRGRRPADHLNWARDAYADKLGLTPVSEFAGMQLSDRTVGAQPCNPQGGWEGSAGVHCRPFPQVRRHTNGDERARTTANKVLWLPKWHRREAA